jgi:hypothetical protein
MPRRFGRRRRICKRPAAKGFGMFRSGGKHPLIKTLLLALWFVLGSLFVGWQLSDGNLTRVVGNAAHVGDDGDDGDGVSFDIDDEQIGADDEGSDESVDEDDAEAAENSDDSEPVEDADAEAAENSDDSELAKDADTEAASQGDPEDTEGEQAEADSDGASADEGDQSEEKSPDEGDQSESESEGESEGEPDDEGGFTMILGKP